MSNFQKFFHEIHRRGLWQVLVVYLGVSWAALEAADQFSGQLGLPWWVYRGLLAVLLVGLPIVLATAFLQRGLPVVTQRDPTLLPDTEAGVIEPAGGWLRTFTWRNAFVGGLFALALWGAVSVGWLLLNPEEPDSLGPASVAVLPLRSAAPEGEETGFLTEGFHTEILTQLTKISELEVIGAKSVARYASTDQSSQEIGSELGVATVLQGSLLKAADGIRLNVQLTDAATGKQLWAEAYAREFSLDQLFEILEDVARQIAAALQVALTPEQQEQIAQKPTEDEDAYEHFLRGENFKTLGVDEDAMAAFERAVTLDSAFAAAWARLAEVRSWYCYMRCVVNPEFHDTVTQALDRARALAPEAIETRFAQATYYRAVGLDYDRAARELDLILELRPNDPDAVYQLGRVRARQGRWEEAETLLRRALALDPFQSKAAEYLANVLRNRGRFTEAATFVDRAAALAPDDGETAAVRMWIYLWGLGDTATVRDFAEHGPPSLLGRRTSGRGELARLSRDAGALERIAQDSVFAEDPYSRNLFLTEVAILRDDSEMLAVHADSLVALWAARLEGSLEMAEVGYRDLAVAWNRSIFGVALALAGEEERAIQEGELAIELWPGEALDRDRVALRLVQVYTFLGHTDEAIDLIERELSVMSPQITPFRLRTDPDFDRLRDHPRFQALLEEIE
jgi:TolB-like protein